MRDVALTVFIFALIPFIFRRPWLGVLMWTWIGLMNPHKLTWGFAFNFPFAQIVGLVTMVSMVLSPERKRFPWTGVVIILVLFIGWMSVTTLFALFPDLAVQQWNKVMKIQLVILMTMFLLQSRERIRLLVWVTVLSLGFYGVKGGLYTLRGGGGGMVVGPPGGFIEGNTEISLAMVMIIPLMVWLLQQEKRTWVRRGLVASILLTSVAVIGSYSRGALLAILAMGVWLWIKSSRKSVIAAVAVLVTPIVLLVMPSAWFQRMDTIEAYQADSSAMGRINAWKFALNLAADRPVVGGGFNSFERPAFLIWAPDPNNFHDSHSIWFQVLGHHGYVGLALFVLLWLSAWRLASRVIRMSGDRPDRRWAAELARMIQVAFVGFWVGGSFLGLAYFDLPYILIAMLALSWRVLEDEKAEMPATGPEAGIRGAEYGNSLDPTPALPVRSHRL